MPTAHTGTPATANPLVVVSACSQWRSRWHTFAVWCAGQRVSRLAVVPCRQQIGSSTVRMGGIAGVVTEEGHRGRGHASRLLAYAQGWMRRRGFATTMLHGIEGFYHRAGFAPACPAVSAHLSASLALPAVERRYRWAPYRRAYTTAALALFRAGNRGRTGVLRRRSAVWMAMPAKYHWNATSAAICRVLLSRDGAMIGYLVIRDRPGTAEIIEAECARADAWPELLRAAQERARAEGAAEIGMDLPEDHPLVQYGVPHGLRQEIRYRQSGGAMVRLVDAAVAIRALEREILPRTGSGPVRCLNLRTDLEEVGLDWSGSGLRVGASLPAAPTAVLPQWGLAQLLYGYRSATALAVAGTLCAPDRLVRVLEDIFPRRACFAYVADEI